MCVCEFFLPLFYFFYEIRSVKGHYSKFDFLHEYRIEPVKSGSVFLRWSSVSGSWSGGAFPRRISQDNSSSRTTLWQLSGGNLSGGCPGIVGTSVLTVILIWLVRTRKYAYVTGCFSAYGLQCLPGDCPGMYVSGDSGSVRSYILSYWSRCLTFIIICKYDWFISQNISQLQIRSKSF